jgi:hypothetical protein
MPAFDANLGMARHHRAGTAFERISLFQQDNAKRGIALRDSVRGHQAADAAADNGNVVCVSLLRRQNNHLCFNIICAAKSNISSAVSGHTKVFYQEFMKKSIVSARFFTFSPLFLQNKRV